MFGRAAGKVSRHALPFLLVAAVVGCGAREEPVAGEPAPAASEPAPAPAELAPASAEAAAPAAELKTLSVEEIRPLLEEQQGKVVVVSFWATWCVPCVEEMPELAKFYEAYRDKGVTFLSLSVDTPAAFEEGKVAAFVQKHELPFPVWVVTERDPAAVSSVMKADWGGTLPATFVYDSKGELVASFDTEVTSDELVAAVAPLLGEAEATF